MSTLTTVNALPKPALSDAPNIESAVNTTLDMIDTRMVARFSTASARDAAITAPVFGQVASVSGTGEIYWYNGSTWVSLAPRFTAGGLSNQNFNSTTLANVTSFSFACEASSRYIIQGCFSIAGAQAADMKIGWTTPGSATGQWSLFGGSGAITSSQTADSFIVENVPYSEVGLIWGIVSSKATTLTLNATLVTTSSGTLQLQAAQGAASGTVTFNSSLSWMKCRKV